jgi:hypothetical protein
MTMDNGRITGWLAGDKDRAGDKARAGDERGSEDEN